MESIALIKSALHLTSKAIAYRNKRADKKPKKRKTKRRGIFLTMFAAMLFVGISIASASFSHDQATSTQQEQQQTHAFQSLGAMMNAGSKALTLSTSATNTLSAYPNTSTNVLRSSTIDQETGIQHYMHYMGKGGVTTSTKATITTLPNNATIQQANNPNCPQPLPGSLRGYAGNIPDPSSSCSNNNNGGDFLTGSGGVLLQIPLTLTADSPGVKGVLTAVQGVSWLFLAPIIMLLGFSIMTKFGNASYADILETMPRFLLALIGIACCQLIAEQLLSIGNAFLTGLWSAMGQGLDPGTIVTPAGQWEGWLVGMFLLGLGFIITNAIAPLMILGTDFGGYIAIGIDVALGIVFIAEAPHFVQLTLSMALGAEIIVRLILINLYIVLSPLAMLALALPGQEGVRFGRDWILGFLSLIASQVGQVVVLGLGLIFLSEWEQHAGGGGGAYSISDIVYDFIKFGTLALMLRVPSLFKSNAADLIKQVGPMVAAGVQHERTIFM